MKSKNKKDLKYYLDLPWTYSIETSKDKQDKLIYIISVNELPGIKTDSTTVALAMKEIKEAMEAAFELYIELGIEIPEPINKETFKGNITYRTSSQRHYLLAKEAQRKKQSLSKIIDECIDTALNKAN